MVPLPSYTTIGGIPVTQFIEPERLDAIVKRTKGGGGEIVKLMGTSAWYAPGAAAAEMVEAIVKNSGRVLPCAVELNGEWGHKGIFMGAPVRLGRLGVEEIIEVNLTPDEKVLLDQSADHVRSSLDDLARIQAG
jgi:malate dehydrogenase